MLPLEILQVKNCKYDASPGCITNNQTNIDTDNQLKCIIFVSSDHDVVVVLTSSSLATSRRQLRFTLKFKQSQGENAG